MASRTGGASAGGLTEASLSTLHARVFEAARASDAALRDEGLEVRWEEIRKEMDEVQSRYCRYAPAGESFAPILRS